MNNILAALREANIQRLPLFKNRRGESYHNSTDGDEWTIEQWMNAVIGELGEAANIIKKIDRQDMTVDEARDMLADELADVMCYFDIYAYRRGCSLPVDLLKVPVNAPLANHTCAAVKILARIVEGKDVKRNIDVFTQGMYFCAMDAGIDLNEAIRKKFNRVSLRVEAAVFINDQYEVITDASKL